MFSFLTFIFLSFNSWGSCSNSFQYNEKEYCIDYNWIFTQKKMRGEYKVTSNLSPHLNLKNTPSYSREYSAIEIYIWEKKDKQKQYIYLDGFRVFPFMTMVNGHHHDASSKIDWKKEAILLSEMALLEMPEQGCWSLRGTFSEDNVLSESFHLFNIEQYQNLSLTDNIELIGICEMCRVMPLAPQDRHDH